MHQTSVDMKAKDIMIILGKRKKERMLLLNKSPTEGGNADIYTNNTWQSAGAILLLKQHILLIVRVC
jgi:hypothetical protein